MTEKLTKTKNLFYLKLLQPAVHSDNKRKARRNKQKLVLASSSKTIICTTRSKPEQHNFCRPTSFSLRVATVLKYFCVRDSFIIEIGVEQKTVT